MKKINERSTVKQVKEHFGERMREGKSSMCPCCNRKVKLYRRNITSAMAYGLILLVQKYARAYSGTIKTGWTSPWFHMESTLKDLGAPNSIRGDMAKWVHWGCLERSDDFREDGNPDTGLYRLTYTAVLFAHNSTKFQKFIKIYNKQFYGFDGPLVGVKDALQDKFNYDELMSR